MTHDFKQSKKKKLVISLKLCALRCIHLHPQIPPSWHFLGLLGLLYNPVSTFLSLPAIAHPQGCHFSNYHFTKLSFVQIILHFSKIILIKNQWPQLFSHLFIFFTFTLSVWWSKAKEAHNFLSSKQEYIFHFSLSINVGIWFYVIYIHREKNILNYIMMRGQASSKMNYEMKKSYQCQQRKKDRAQLDNL